MFLRNDHGFESGGGTVAAPFGRADVTPGSAVVETLRDRLAAIDWTPDLGARIGSPEWFRGAATCLALCTATWMLSPGLHRPLTGTVPAPLAGTQWDEARAQSIAPIAWGATTGRHMAAGDLVRPLAETPERPIIDLTATLGEGDDFAHVLERAGVANNEAAKAASLISDAVPVDDLKPGTQIDITLGRRASKSVPRPLEKLSLRARFDLNLAVERAGSSLTLDRQPIAIDHTPLRIEGKVGSSLYRSARAAGVPASIVADYIKAIAAKTSIGSIGADDTFDIIVERARAATGETQLGKLAFAGLDTGSKTLQLVRWKDGDQETWFSASGRGATERRTGGLPVAGHITSTFGRRYHPILHYYRMHEGVDVGAPYGSPIHATAAGTVVFAGRNGGYGNFVRINIGGHMTTGFGHMSRIAVHSGEHVSAGEVIGYVGSTGLSTGPHVHYEVRRNNVPINPLSVALSGVAQLSGSALRAFKAHVATLLAVKPRGVEVAAK